MTKRLFFGCATALLILILPRAYAQTEHIGNGGFEAGPANPSPWVIQGSVISTNLSKAHDGHCFLSLGGATTWTDAAYQTVSIPAGITSGRLSFYYSINTSDDPSAAYDHLSAVLVDTNGNTLATLGNWSNVDADQGTGSAYYHYLTFDVLSYAGQTVRLKFMSDNDDSYPTSLLIDDVSIVTTSPPDLRANIYLPSNSVVSGGSITVQYELSNSADTDAPATHTKVVIKDVANNIFSEQTFSEAPLSGFNNRDEAHSVALIGANAGTYYVSVVADADNEAGQINRTNDTSLAVPITVHQTAGLMINPVFDSSIMDDTNSAAIQSAIDRACEEYEELFSDPITVTIQFSETTSYLWEITGGSSYFITYSNLLNALNADAQTTNDAIALAHLPAGSVNPANGNSNIVLMVPNLRALGLGGNILNQQDGAISINVTNVNLTRSDIDTNKYDMKAILQHGINYILGMQSSLDFQSIQHPTGPVTIMDLYRYDQSGARSFTMSSTAQAYFSLDCVTDLAQFCQDDSGYFWEWYNPGNQTPRVEDGSLAPGAMPDLGVELIALDAIGYNLVTAVPVPILTSSISAKFGNTITLTWTSQTNLNYQLQYKTNLTQATWANLGAAITARGETTSASDTISTTPRFYRVAVSSRAPSIVQQKLVSQQPALPLVTNSIRSAIRF